MPGSPFGPYRCLSSHSPPQVKSRRLLWPLQQSVSAKVLNLACSGRNSSRRRVENCACSVWVLRTGVLSGSPGGCLSKPPAEDSARRRASRERARGRSPRRRGRRGGAAPQGPAPWASRPRPPAALRLGLGSALRRREEQQPRRRRRRRREGSWAWRREGRGGRAGGTAGPRFGRLGRLLSSRSPLAFSACRRPRGRFATWLGPYAQGCAYLRRRPGGRGGREVGAAAGVGGAGRRRRVRVRS